MQVLQNLGNLNALDSRLPSHIHTGRVAGIHISENFQTVF